MDHAQRFFVLREFGLGGPIASQCRYNDRGLQCDDRLVHLTETRLPWRKGGWVEIDSGYSIGSISLELDDDLYTYTDDFISPEAMVIEATDNNDYKVTAYFFKLLTGPNASSQNADFTIFGYGHRQDTTSFLAGVHLFKDVSETEDKLVYVNDLIDIRRGHEWQLHDSGSGVIAVYRGQIYFFSDNRLVRATYLDEGRQCKEMVIASFPKCRYMRQDDRHPRYLCGVGDGHVIQFIVDLEDMVILNMPDQDDEESIYMPGVVEGVMKCFVFSLNFVKGRLRNTFPSAENEYLL